MVQPNGTRPCPGCGATVDTQYCPHCGSRTVPADQPVWSGRDRTADDAESPTVPRCLSVPASDATLAGRSGDVPDGDGARGDGRTSRRRGRRRPTRVTIRPDHRAACSRDGPACIRQWPPPGAPGALAPRPERRRKAIYAVAGIAAATVLVLLAAMLVAPHLGSSNEVADKDGQPVAVSSRAGSSSAVCQCAGLDGHPLAASRIRAPNTAAATGARRSATITVTTTARQPTTSTRRTSPQRLRRRSKPAPKAEPKPTAKKPAEDDGKKPRPVTRCAAARHRLQWRLYRAARFGTGRSRRSPPTWRG